uniref:FAM136A n=1 Tax=Caligus clemensi TaxID=344056 RepID=C1C2C2_CALCM|nr:FAM136A [Caligus clemensi]
MSEAAQERVQNAIKTFVNGLDKSHIRGMDRTMHECAAACLSDTEASIDSVHSCIDRCQAPTLRAQKFVQSELEQFQSSLSRCILSCQDEVKDKLSPSSTEAEITKFRSEFDTCAINRCDKNIARLPNITKKVRDTLDSEKY